MNNSIFRAIDHCRQERPARNRLAQWGLAAAVMVFAATDASSQTGLPKYNPDAWCKQVASVGGGGSETIKRGCLDMEQAAYDELKEIWTGLPAKTRKWCDQVARSGGSGSYATLQGCIQMETDSGEQNKATEFKW